MHTQPRGVRFTSRGRFIPLGGRGRMGHALLGNVVGGVLFPDNEVAAKQLALGYDQAYIDIGHQIGVLPYEGSGERVKQHPAVWLTWWQSSAAPLFRAWNDFKREQIGEDQTVAPNYVTLGERLLTAPAVYIDWHNKLLGLRAGAQLLGIMLTTPKPAPLPTTTAQDIQDLVERGGRKALDAAGDVWSLAKVAVYGGLGLFGAVVVGSLVSNLRSGKDPASNYLAIARRR